MADFAVRFSDFTGGEWGQLDPVRANANQFTGENVQVYDSGLLGVRPGMKTIPVTGMPLSTVVSGPVGFDVFGDKLVLISDQPYLIPMTNPSLAAAMGNYPGGPARTTVRFARGAGALYTLWGGKLFFHGSAPGAGVLVTTPAPLSTVVRWGYFFVGVDANTPWRLWFSQVDAAGPNFQVWPANNYLDVGSNDPITTLNPIFNTLYCGKSSGWYAVSGTLGVLASVREVLAGNGPIDQRTTSVTTDNRIVYWPVEKVPVFFNGERVQRVQAQRMDPRSLPFPGDTVIVTPTGQKLLLAGTDTSVSVNTSLWEYDRIWTHHDLGAKMAGFARRPDVKSGVQMPEHVIFGVTRSDAAGQPITLLSYQHSLDRPGAVGDTWAAPDDNSSGVPVWGQFRTPAWFDGQGRQVRVRGLIIQFRKWNSGQTGSAMNRLSAAVNSLGPYGGGQEAGAPQDWIEPVGRASTDGTDDSVRFAFGEQGFGNGFQVNVSRMQGVAIREIVAVCDVRSDRI